MTMKAQLEMLVLTVAFWSGSSAAEALPHVAPVLPTVNVSGSSDGKAKLQAGADFLFGISDFYDLSISPTVSTSAVDGFANLFQSSGAESKPWALGLQLTLSKLPETRRAESIPKWREIKEQSSVALHAAKVCCVKNACPVAVTSSSADRAFCAGYQQDHDAMPQAGAFCDVAACESEVKEVNSLQKKQEKRLRDIGYLFNAFTISVGGRAGRSEFSFVDQSSGVGVEATTSKVPFAFAISGAWIGTSEKIGAPTFEVAATVSSVWNAGKLPIRWCHDLPGVRRDPMDPMSPTDTAQSCKDSVAQKPSNTLTGTVDITAGYVDTKNTFWRASGGLRFEVANTTATAIKAGIVAPIYLAFANLSNAYAGEYKGLVRITPGILFTRDSGKAAVEGYVSIELLGKRNLFLGALDHIR